MWGWDDEGCLPSTWTPAPPPPPAPSKLASSPFASPATPEASSRVPRHPRLLAMDALRDALNLSAVLDQAASTIDEPNGSLMEHTPFSLPPSVAAPQTPPPSTPGPLPPAPPTPPFRFGQSVAPSSSFTFDAGSGFAPPASPASPPAGWQPSGYDIFAHGIRSALGPMVVSQVRGRRLVKKSRQTWGRLSLSERKRFEELAMAYAQQPTAQLLADVAARASPAAQSLAFATPAVPSSRSTPVPVRLHSHELRADVQDEGAISGPRRRRRGARRGHTQGGATARPTPPMGEG